MDQGAIANFKKYFIRRTYRQALKAVEDDPNMTLSDFWKSLNIYMCIKHIDASWREVSQTSMNVFGRVCARSVQGEDEEED